MKHLRAQDFQGQWRLTRRIEDRRLRIEGELEGEAILVPVQDGTLTYRETGELRFGDSAPLEASRAYQWAFDEAVVKVAFTDGRPFHDFVPEGLHQGSDHQCGSDRYRVEYDFTNWPQWRAIWTVKGPRKDYTSISEYAPA